ncbi:MAG: hypothetical protein ACI9V9_001071, partial [Oleispira sp.]
HKNLSTRIRSFVIKRYHNTTKIVENTIFDCFKK